MKCLATASSDSNYQGLERQSPTITVSSTDGVCKPQRAGFGGGEPYLTKIKYLGKQTLLVPYCHIIRHSKPDNFYFKRILHHINVRCVIIR